MMSWIFAVSAISIATITLWIEHRQRAARDPSPGTSLTSVSKNMEKVPIHEEKETAMKPTPPSPPPPYVAPVALPITRINEKLRVRRMDRIVGPQHVREQQEDYQPPGSRVVSTVTTGTNLVVFFGDGTSMTFVQVDGDQYRRDIDSGIYGPGEEGF